MASPPETPPLGVTATTTAAPPDRARAPEASAAKTVNRASVPAVPPPMPAPLASL